MPFVISVTDKWTIVSRMWFIYPLSNEMQDIHSDRERKRKWLAGRQRARVHAHQVAIFICITHTHTHARVLKTLSHEYLRWTISSHSEEHHLCFNTHQIWTSVKNQKSKQKWVSFISISKSNHQANPNLSRKFEKIKLNSATQLISEIELKKIVILWFFRSGRSHGSPLFFFIFLGNRFYSKRATTCWSLVVLRIWQLFFVGRKCWTFLIFREKYWKIRIFQ